MQSAHDNEIVSYEVNLRSEKIILHTEYQTSKVDVIFSGVLVHLFEQELPGSIILRIEKYDIIEFLEDYSELLKKLKPYCWPFLYKTEEELRERLLKGQYFYYVILSSHGLNGWVVAKEYEALNVDTVFPNLNPIK
ncbi:hypothetical protein D3C72_1787280 [compost metagenome]